MTAFAYTAIDATTGREATGTLHGKDDDSAVAELKARGLFPTRVAEVASRERTGTPVEQSKAPHAAINRRSPGRRRPAGKQERMIFTRQLAALVGAGMPLVRALDLVASQEQNPAWREVIVGLADGIRAGGTLARGMMRHPRVFDRLYVGMVTAGESGGRIEVVLERLARHLEKSGRVESRVKAAMTYPIVVMTVAVAIVAALMTFVVPRFEKIFLTMPRARLCLR